jgi:hypothetical protein
MSTFVIFLVASPAVFIAVTAAVIRAKAIGYRQQFNDEVALEGWLTTRSARQERRRQQKFRTRKPRRTRVAHPRSIAGH